MDWWTAIGGGTDLSRAGRDIDTLTFCRIRALGWEGLTPFQQSVVSEVALGLMQFQSENAELLESAVSGYSLNGASVQYDGGISTTRINGVVIPWTLYTRLEQTGLTCPVLRG